MLMLLKPTDATNATHDQASARATIAAAKSQMRMPSAHAESAIMQQPSKR